MLIMTWIWYINNTEHKQKSCHDCLLLQYIWYIICLLAWFINNKKYISLWGNRDWYTLQCYQTDCKNCEELTKSGILPISLSHEICFTFLHMVKYNISFHGYQHFLKIFIVTRSILLKVCMKFNTPQWSDLYLQLQVSVRPPPKRTPI